MTNNFFEEEKLYPPEEEKVLEYYKEYFDEVFIVLIPFSKINDEKIKNYIKNKSSIEKIDDIKNRIINIERLKNYPYYEENLSEIEEYYFAEKINWDEIIENTGISNIKDLNKALMTAIGALKKELQEPEILKILIEYCTKNKIYIPNEGAYDLFSKLGIYKCLIENNLSEIFIIEEFNNSLKKINVENFSDLDLINSINFKDYYIYSKNKEILFSIDWDYFFFFIGIDSKKISKESIEKNFFGFWASSEDSHLWCWEEGEIEKKLNLKIY